VQKSQTNRAQWFMNGISIVGWSVIAYISLTISFIEQPLELLFLLTGVVICELLPVKHSKGNTSLAFPLIFITYYIHGVELAATLYFSSVLLATIIAQRPVRLIFFNPAQLVISLVSAHLLTDLVVQYYLTEYSVLFASLFFICAFYILNNILVDIVLFLRPEPYSAVTWFHKVQNEFYSFIISIIYGWLIYFLGGQDRGEVDIIAYFFFFSPLIALALISSVITRLKADKVRLRELFYFSSELTKAIPIHGSEEIIKSSIKKIVSYEELFLFKLDENNQWEIIISDGLSTFSEEMVEMEMEKTLKTTMVYNKHDLQRAPLSQNFHPSIRSAVYSPLIIDEDLKGVLLLTKTRTKSFLMEDIHTIATIANQLAIFLQTQLLFTEKQQRILLEERNRIAHDIHDGIAQTLAGALMKLDIATKKMAQSPQEAEWLVSDSSSKIREGLKELRDSIYALRHSPTKQIGLHAAIEQKVEEGKLHLHSKAAVDFTVVGNLRVLNEEVERVVYSIVQEALYNSLKHAQATKINIELIYQSEDVVVKVEDNGIGFSLYEAMTIAMKEPHYGILQMNEDADQVGATLNIDSRKLVGTKITLRLPTEKNKRGEKND
jgi:signal transduction histidine kinase